MGNPIGTLLIIAAFAPFSIADNNRKILNFEKISKLQFSAYIKLQVKDKKGVLSNITKDFSDSKVSI